MSTKTDVENALIDIAAEFARSYGDEMTEEMRELVLQYFNNTVRKGIEDYGVRWQEPIRSYALKHAAKIGRKLARQANGDAHSLGEIADDVILKARDACELKKDVLPMELGPLCPPL